MRQKTRAALAGPFPVRLTSFVGRVDELQRVSEELRRHRLVSVVGPGGCGKTRLALEVGQSWAGGQRWFVDLAPMEPAGVGVALAVATEAPEGPGEEPLDATVRRISDEPALLLVDNCDQVLAACAHAVEVLLRACPGLTVLATSREPVRVEGEHVWRAPPLSLPADDDSDHDSLDGDAVLLFLDRASLAPSDALVSRAAIHELCRRLDGMPLAIELAASRAAALPVSDILAGLSDRFRLLTGGPRTTDTRQQSLAASIHWSYRLLTDEERTVLQRLAVFRAPFTAEAARAVAASGDIDDRDVLALLASLVEKSFVVVDERHEIARYRLLETIREYATQELETNPDEAHLTKHRHLRHLRDAAERIEAVWDGPSIADLVDRLEAEVPDIRAALAWAAATENADDALRLAGALGWFWYLWKRGEGRALLDAALAADGGDDRWRAKALTGACWVAGIRLDPAAFGLGQEAVQLATPTGDRSLTARALGRLGWTYALFSPAQARPHLTRACELAREAGDAWCLASSMSAVTYTELGHLPTARARAAAALALATSNGNRLTTCWAQLATSIVALLQGQLDTAGVAAAEARNIAKMFDDRGDLALAYTHLTWHATLRGDEDEAAQNAEAAQTIAKAMGNPLALGAASFTTGAAQYAIGELESAQAALVESLPIGKILGGGALGPYAVAMLADAARRSGDHVSARRHTRDAVELAETAGLDWGRARAALAMSRLDLHEGEVDAAAEAAHRAMELAEHNEDAISIIDALELLARIAACRRTPESATRLLAAAASERARIGYARFRVHTDEHEALLRELETALGPDELGASWRQGEQLTVAEAVALARSRRGSRARPAVGWDALTPAERRVGRPGFGGDSRAWKW